MHDCQSQVTRAEATRSTYSTRTPFAWSEVVVFLGLLLYVADIPWMHWAFYALITAFVFFAFLKYPRRTVRAFARPSPQVLIVWTIYTLYAVFALRHSVHGEP